MASQDSPATRGVEWSATIWRPLAPHLVDPTKTYQIIAYPAQEALAKKFAQSNPKKFTYHTTQWDKFKDGTDNIEVGGFYPLNHIRGSNVIFLASFHNNDAMMSQFHVLNMLCESGVLSLTVILPYWSLGTTPTPHPRDPILSRPPSKRPATDFSSDLGRAVREGQVATGNSLARLLSNLPYVGKPTRVMIYDIHMLQNRFYLSGNALATLHTAMPLLIGMLKSSQSNIDCIAFPDEGACKRFKGLFEPSLPDWPVITCGKKTEREGNSQTYQRNVAILDGDPKGKHVIIIDDLVQTGGTLVECAQALKAAGAQSVSAYVTHAVFPSGWDFALASKGGPFQNFYLSNSNPTVTDRLPTDDCFKVLDLFPVMVQDLD